MSDVKLPERKGENMAQEPTADQAADASAPAKTLTPQAERALAEAQARRAQQQAQNYPAEINGRAGPEPVRYGDWENGGIASDF
jgi:hypothetical protein